MYNVLHPYSTENRFSVGAATLLIELMPNAQCDAAHLRLSGVKPNPDMIYDEKLWNPPPPPPTKTINQHLSPCGKMRYYHCIHRYQFIKPQLKLSQQWVVM